MHRTAPWPSPTRTLYDSEGKACAHATGTFKYVKSLPPGKERQSLNTISPTRRAMPQNRQVHLDNRPR